MVASIFDDTLTAERLSDALAHSERLVCLDIEFRGSNPIAASAAVLGVLPDGQVIPFGRPIQATFGSRPAGTDRSWRALPGADKLRRDIWERVGTASATPVIWAQTRRPHNPEAAFLAALTPKREPLDLQAIVDLATRRAPASPLAQERDQARGLADGTIISNHMHSQGQKLRAAAMSDLLIMSVNTLRAQRAGLLTATLPAKPKRPPRDYRRHTPADVLFDETGSPEEELRLDDAVFTGVVQGRARIGSAGKPDPDFYAIMDELAAEDPTFSRRPFWQYLYAVRTLRRGQNYALEVAEHETAYRVRFFAEATGSQAHFTDLVPEKRVTDKGFDGIFKGKFPLLWGDAIGDYVGMETKTLALTSLGASVSRIVGGTRDQYRNGALARAIKAIQENANRNDRPMTEGQEKRLAILLDLQKHPDKMYTLFLLRLRKRDSEPVPLPRKAHNIFNGILVTNLFGDLVLYHGMPRIGDIRTANARFGQRGLVAWGSCHREYGDRLPVTIEAQMAGAGDPPKILKSEMVRRECHHCTGAPPPPPLAGEPVDEAFNEPRGNNP